MLDEVYNGRILNYAGNIPRIGQLARPDGRGSAHSRLCGSKVSVEIALQDGVIADFAHDVKACALGQASSSIMARNVIGASPDEIREGAAQMRRMLGEGGTAPTGRWAEFKWLEPVRDFRARHASTMLTFDAIEAALIDAEQKASVKDVAADLSIDGM